MPAASPSQAAISNALSAIVDSGIVPQSIRIDHDGGFVVQFFNPSSVSAGFDLPDELTGAADPPAYE